MPRNLLTRRPLVQRHPVVRVRLAAPAPKIFVVGGSRSGKSAFAQKMAERWRGPLLFVATLAVRDEESRSRVAAHRQKRSSRWHTVDAGVDLAACLSACPEASCVLVDSLGTWVSGVLCHCFEGQGEVAPAHDAAGDAATMDALAKGLLDFSKAVRDSRRPVIVVSDEVGLGLVPPDAMGRVFRDVLGLANQTLAAQADEAYFLSCGLPLRLKGRPS